MTARNLDRPSLHGCYVQKIASGGFFASCPSCGCEPFPDRAAEDEARADGVRHQEEIAARGAVA